jgi:hypothetical protein
MPRIRASRTEAPAAIAAGTGQGRSKPPPLHAPNNSPRPREVASVAPQRRNVPAVQTAGATEGMSLLVPRQPLVLCPARSRRVLGLEFSPRIPPFMAPAAIAAGTGQVATVLPHGAFGAAA